MASGPLEGVTIDHQQLIRNLFQTLDWDEDTGKPDKRVLRELGGMEEVIEALDL